MLSRDHLVCFHLCSSIATKEHEVHVINTFGDCLGNGWGAENHCLCVCWGGGHLIGWRFCPRFYFSNFTAIRVINLLLAAEILAIPGQRFWGVMRFAIRDSVPLSS